MLSFNMGKTGDVQLSWYKNSHLQGISHIQIISTILTRELLSNTWDVVCYHFQRRIIEHAVTGHNIAGKTCPWDTDYIN